MTEDEILYEIEKMRWEFDEVTMLYSEDQVLKAIELARKGYIKEDTEKEWSNVIHT